MERLMRQFVKQLRPRNETYTPLVDKIQSSLNEGGSTIGATEMESHIVIAFNGGYDNAPETYGVSKKDYESGKDISEKIEPLEALETYLTERGVTGKKRESVSPPSNSAIYERPFATLSKFNP